LKLQRIDGAGQVPRENQQSYIISDKELPPYSSGEIRPYEPDLIDKWSENSNFFASIIYSIIDDLYLFYQASPFGAVFVTREERTHLNGVLAIRSEVENGFFGGLSIFMPSPVKGQGYIKNMPKHKIYSNELFSVLNSSQFGTKFKGTFITKGSMRYSFNRYYNKGVRSLNDWYNSSSVKTIGNKLFPFLYED
jgi:hypothetical protein